MNELLSSSYGLSIVTGPSGDALELDEAKEHLRVTIDDDDAYIKRLIIVATNHVQEHTRWQLLSTTFDFRLDKFPSGSKPIELPVMNATGQPTITYIDANGVTQTLASTEWKVSLDRQPPRITPAYSKIWPTARREPDAVTIRFTAGWTDPSGILDDIKQAMLLLIGHLYENREEVITGTIQAKLERTVDALLAPYGYEAEFTEFGT